MRAIAPRSPIGWRRSTVSSPQARRRGADQPPWLLLVAAGVSPPLGSVPESAGVVLDPSPIGGGVAVAALLGTGNGVAGVEAAAGALAAPARVYTPPFTVTEAGTTLGALALAVVVLPPGVPKLQAPSASGANAARMIGFIANSPCRIRAECAARREPNQRIIKN